MKHPLEPFFDHCPVASFSEEGTRVVGGEPLGSLGFSSFEDWPSVDHLLDHYPEIKLLVERDAPLAKSQVFSCVNATCGRFYHPKCVADLLFQENKAEAAEYEDKIAAGESFTCPVHKCHVCKQGENKGAKELQFAMCRRCPKSYHRKCLPRRNAFEDIEEEGIIQRAWEGLLPHHILIYCLKHKHVEDLGTPIRNHIVFPQVPERSKSLQMCRKINGKSW